MTINKETTAKKIPPNFMIRFIGLATKYRTDFLIFIYSFIFIFIYFYWQGAFFKSWHDTLLSKAPCQGKIAKEKLVVCKGLKCELKPE